MKTTLVLAAAVFVLGPTCRAATPTDLGAAAVTVATEINRGIGRMHDPYLAPRLTGAVIIDGWFSWCHNGGVRSVSAQGEASFLYMEIYAAVKPGEALQKSRETLLRHTQMLAGFASALTGTNAGDVHDLARLEQEVAEGRKKQSELVAREAALRRMLIDAKWASVDPDGVILLNMSYGTDLQSVGTCGGAGD